jgi:hypothetical protein
MRHRKLTHILLIYSLGIEEVIKAEVRGGIIKTMPHYKQTLLITQIDFDRSVRRIKTKRD